MLCRPSSNEHRYTCKTGYKRDNTRTMAHKSLILQPATIYSTMTDTPVLCTTTHNFYPLYVQATGGASSCGWLRECTSVCYSIFAHSRNLGNVCGQNSPSVTYKLTECLSMIPKDKSKETLLYQQVMTVSDSQWYRLYGEIWQLNSMVSNVGGCTVDNTSTRANHWATCVQMKCEPWTIKVTDCEFLVTCTWHTCDMMRKSSKALSMAHNLWIKVQFTLKKNDHEFCATVLYI